MNAKLRTEVVRAMETIIRSINDEELIMPWLSLGVADGDITDNPENDDLEYYIEDENFSELMHLFTSIMEDVHKDGGLYVDGILSKGAEEEQDEDMEL